jgi:hypothetical protein
MAARNNITEATSEPMAVESLPTKVIQIQAASLPGDSNSGPHSQLFALCEDGSVWVQYHSSGYSNVPTDGMWRTVNRPALKERQSRCRICWGKGKVESGLGYMVGCECQK